jgi:hypothetical protein
VDLNAVKVGPPGHLGGVLELGDESGDLAGFQRKPGALPA